MMTAAGRGAAGGGGADVGACTTPLTGYVHDPLGVMLIVPLLEFQVPVVKTVVAFSLTS